MQPRPRNGRYVSRHRRTRLGAGDVEHRLEVKSYRSPSEDPPPSYQDPDLWFQTQYELTCDGRTYYAWSYETRPGTVNIPSYREAGKRRDFEFVPYRDRTFCRVARHLMSSLGCDVIVWCQHGPVTVEASRLKC